MSSYGSVARMASASPARPDEGAGRAGRDRRRPGAREGALRSRHRDPRGPAPGRVGSVEATRGAEEDFAQASADGLDPAFDEMGELFDHVDGLSRWMRLDRAHPRHRDD